jgi:hypothetical protein
MLKNDHHLTNTCLLLVTHIALVVRSCVWKKMGFSLIKRFFLPLFYDMHNPACMTWCLLKVSVTGGT